MTEKINLWRIIPKGQKVCECGDIERRHRCVYWSHNCQYYCEVCWLNAPPLNVKNFLWLIFAYLLSIIPFTRNLLREYEETIGDLQNDLGIYVSTVVRDTRKVDGVEITTKTIISASDVIKSESSARRKYTNFWWDSRRELDEAADYWTKYGEKRARKEAIRSFTNLEWLDHPSFTPEEKLHADAIREAITHSMGAGMRLDMRIRQLRECEAEKHREWLASSAGKKYIASTNEACRLMSRNDASADKQQRPSRELPLPMLAEDLLKWLNKEEKNK